MDVRSLGSSPTKSSASSDTIGTSVERLKVEVEEGVGVYISNAQYSIPRLKEHYGKELCWPVAVTNKKWPFSLSVCPCKGKPGHEVDGVLHQIDMEKKGEFHKNSKSFRLREGEPGFRSAMSGNA